MKPTAKFIRHSSMWMVHQRGCATGFGFTVAEALKAFKCMAQPKVRAVCACGLDEA
ncbi:MAG: hypothetical protein ABJA84_00210 [Polaromonas sp.]